ncbi:hypothetical protein KQX63_08860 [Rhodopseudomonas palustris]|uniref:hypothetical protein n=1 Tax=Rhodopseudomonas palustris TaxID=1076 RepID=UPI0021F2D645|nr:hypothetical protein [Rhodopseudomonas palustris]UYO46102.1 hypothetical protein KQX63_08860 [Rhodopseudomonas palustris]
MAFDTSYLGRSLDNRLPDVYETLVREINSVQAKHAAAGRLQSGATLTAFEEIAASQFKSAVADASKFTFEFTAGHEPEAQACLKNFANRVQQMIMAEISENADRLNLGAVTATQIEKVRAKLERFKEQALSDFSHGMQGSERLRRDPLVSVITNQTNSPGSIQQVGIGDSFSQTAFTQNHNELVAAIDRVLISQEFSRLSPEQKEAFSDTAAVVKEEAIKAEPDVGKLKRWGSRLVDLGKELGMKVATAEIVHLLAKMFGA